MKRNQKGLSGISTLIIFIAIILVAAIAALVLLQTVSTLQSQALATGKQSKEQVSTQLQVEKVIADVNVDSNTNVQKLRITTKLSPGSAKINLSQMLMSIKADSFFRAGLDYNKATANTTTAVEAATGGATGTNTDANTVYSVLWLASAPSVRTAVEEGDLIEIWVSVSGDLRTNEDVVVELGPSGGVTTRVYFKTPVVFDSSYERIFP